MPKNIKQLFQEHTGKISDSWSLYLGELDRVFAPYRTLPVNILEIGVQNGGSLEIWGKYFLNSKIITGCDIEDKCGELRFSDKRISVVVGDANSEECERKIHSAASVFDIIIDDGSHQSGDIVRSFARYYPHLSYGGIYIVEDLHTSYWQGYEGGLHNPLSAMAFFKRLTDLINYEHWRENKSAGDFTEKFTSAYKISLDNIDFLSIHSIEFINSLCIIKKLPPEKNTLGIRKIVGIEERITTNWKDQDNTTIHDLNAKIAEDSDLDVFALISKTSSLEKEISDLDTDNSHKEQTIRELNSDLIEKKQSINALNGENKLYTEKIDSLNQLLAKKDQTINRSRSQRNKQKLQIADLSKQLAEKSNHLEKISANLSENEQVIQTLKKEISELSWQIQALQRSLGELTASKAWQVSLQFRRLRLFLLPPGSRRLRFARLVKPVAIFPFTIRNTIRNSRDTSIIRKSGLFDTDWYLSHNTDIQKAGIDPLKHFVRHGWKEWRNPSGEFDVKYYLENNIDVRTAGINPLTHFINHGRKEGRRCKPPKISGQSYTPKVSVIVPNFNHDMFLEKRLSSIYSQTYSNFEVILLDDCSTDNSQEILHKYHREFPEITRLYINEKNSGSAFAQWKKGMAHAKGELIWIAESDDFCESNFLETLVPFFVDEAILLTYAHSVFVDENGRKSDFAFENYLSEISLTKWNSTYTATAHDEVNSCLGVKNTIPNVSSVLFRKPTEDPGILTDKNWLKMKICGDWYFYLHLIRGGKVAYCVDTNNYYRIHPTSSSKKTHSQDVYYREHEQIACAIASLYKVPDSLLSRNHKIIEDFYFVNVKNGTEDRFDKLFNLNKVLNWKTKRTPNVLMAAFAFSFGGGEVFPIRLANALHERGTAVTFFNAGFEPTHPDVRRMLDPHIPVVTYHPSMDVKKVIKTFGIDIIHSHHASVENFFALETKGFHYTGKHVATMHGMYEMMDDFKYDTKDIVKGVDHWFYLTDKNILPFKKYGFYFPDKFTKITNGIKPPQIHPVNLADLGINPDTFTACIASRALPEKGWMEAIDAIELAREFSRKDIHLLLLGEGPVYDTLKRMDLPPYIHLLGYRSNVIDYFAASSVGLVPSYFKGESFPLVIIECFFAGKPIIASNIGETSNMISANNQKGGIIINLRNEKIDANDISLAILEMLDDKKYKEFCDATMILKKKFDIDLIAGQYEKIYSQLLENT